MPNSPLCVDASLVIRLLVQAAESSAISGLWAEWKTAGRRLVAPALLYFEISNALHRYVVSGHLTSEEADEALEIALALDIRLHYDADLHRQAVALARQLKLPAVYDAHYLALAQRLNSELWTADQKLLRTIGEALPFVHGVSMAK